MILPAILLVFATACKPTSPIENPSATVCESGFILYGSVCVPESCGTDRWGNLPVDEDTVHVDIAAEEGGDGTEEAPYTTIQRGLNRAGALGGGLVAVAAGTYPESLEFTTDHADVHLAGRCRDMVILDASVGDEETPGISIDAEYAVVEMSGMTVRDSPGKGLWMASGDATIRETSFLRSRSWGVEANHFGNSGMADLTMEGCIIAENTEMGMLVAASGTQVILRDTTVKDTLPNADERLGLGIGVQGASLSAEGCLIEGNTEIGVAGSGSDGRIALLDTIVRDTHSNVDGEFGLGIQIDQGAHLSAGGCLIAGNDDIGVFAFDSASLQAEGCLVEGNHSTGLIVDESGTQASLQDFTVKGTQPDANGEYGWGIQVSHGAILSAVGCSVDGNTDEGLVAASSGTQVTLRNTAVRGTLPNAKGGFGRGVSVQEGAALSAEGCIIEGNTDDGLFASGQGTIVTLRNTTIRDTQPVPSGQGGYGIGVLDGAYLSADNCLVEGNTVLGIAAVNPGSEVVLRDTTVRDTRPDAGGMYGRGIEVQDGAAFSSVRCLIEANADFGLSASDAGSHVILQDTVVSNTPDSNREGAYGLEAIDGAFFLAESCIFEGNSGIGLLFSGPGTEVELRNTTVKDTRQDPNGDFSRGIQVDDGAAVSIENCHINENSEMGVILSGPGTQVTLVDTTVTGTHPNADGALGRGIEAQDGAFLSVDGCNIDGNTEMGIFVATRDTKATLRDTTVRDTRASPNGEFGIGIGINNGATLSAEDCLIEGNTIEGLAAEGPGTEITLVGTTVKDTLPNTNGFFGQGIAVLDDATLSATGCSIEGNSDAGLLADGAHTQVTLRDTAVSGTKRGNNLRASAACGVTVQSEATLVASQLTVFSNHGPGLIVNGEEAVLECSECTIEDNLFAGAAALHGGSISITDSIIQRTTADINLLGGAGVYAWPWWGELPTVTLTNSLIRDNPVAGVWLIGNGAFVLTGNTISGGTGETFGSGSRCGDAILAMDGVTAWDGTSGLLLQDNDLLDASGSGIFLDNSSALLSGNAYSGNAVDLVVQNQSCDSIPAWYSEAPQHEFCPLYSYPSCYAEFFFVAVPADPIDWEDDKGLGPQLLPSPQFPDSLARVIRPTKPAAIFDHPSHTLVLPR